MSKPDPHHNNPSAIVTSTDRDGPNAHTPKQPTHQLKSKPKHRLLESGARYDEDSPGQHYRSAGLSLIAIGSTIMFMAVWTYLIEREDTQQDHVSNMLVAALIMVTGFWLKSHEHEELD